MQNILIVLVLVILAFFGYKYFQPEWVIADTPVANATATITANGLESIDGIRPTYNESVDESSAPAIAPVIKTEIATPKTVIAKAASHRCDGRQHCSQMRSCAEATYFSNKCPNTKMDGNNDGVPCEQQ